MALVERLMQTDPDPVRHIAVHEFFAAVTEIVAGALTVAQVQTYYAMTADDLTEWAALQALIPGTDVGRALFLGRIHAVFILGAHRVPTYSTPTEVRARLGI